jgi:hypothetical protein
VIILLHPDESILKDDGVRKKASLEELERITEIYKEVFEKYELSYHEIASLDNRAEAVLSIISNSETK